MEPYQREFIRFAMEHGVLRFGEFVLKSGRESPYFFNSGLFNSGGSLAQLARFYATAIIESGVSFDMLYGPAYKGIPLVATTSIALAEHGRTVGFCFNRKEAKDHGEGGTLVGAVPEDGDRVLIVEDVTTAGTSIRETTPVLRAAAEIDLVGLIVSLDRQERGTGAGSALEQVGREFDMRTRAIVNLDEVVEHLHGREIDGVVHIDNAMLRRIEAYREEFGA